LRKRQWKISAVMTLTTLAETRESLVETIAALHHRSPVFAVQRRITRRRMAGGRL